MEVLEGIVLTMYAFGRTSKNRLNTCHPRIRQWMHGAIERAPLDFGVVCGWRGKDEQQAAYANGKSNARWGQSDHNYMLGDLPCSLAIDVAPYGNGNYLWEDEYLFRELNGFLTKEANMIGLKIEWGGDYRSIVDLPHYSIKI